MSITYGGCILQQSFGYIPRFEILNLIEFLTSKSSMCFFVFLKNPMTFGYSVNVFKKILKKYLRGRNYVTLPYV